MKTKKELDMRYVGVVLLIALAVAPFAGFGWAVGIGVAAYLFAKITGVGMLDMPVLSAADMAALVKARGVDYGWESDDSRARRESPDYSYLIGNSWHNIFDD